jgi:acylphosphatase
MQKIKAKITGRKVHDVGYRVLLVNKALSLGVDNFNAFNTHFDGVQAVIVVIEADDETMEEFKSFLVSTRPEKSLVDEVSFEEYRNNVPPIERIMQSFQMEQWGKGIPILLRIVDTLDAHTSILNDNTSILKQNTSILKDFKTETNENFNDLKSINSKHDIDAGERFSSIRKEISDIKARLSNVESAVSAT